MAMSHRIQPILHPVSISDLRPTQMTVGLREVARKRAQWRARATHEGGQFLGNHMIPAVVGPGPKFWIIDHHHLARALHEEGVETVLVAVEAKLDHLPKKRFMAYMDAQNWLHPYDAEGKRQDWEALPKSIAKLGDDPYRSLAGEVRRAGGYAKTGMPYSEFMWADFFRERIRLHQIESRFARAVAKAVELARGAEAGYLPGFAGPSTD